MVNLLKLCSNYPPVTLKPLQKSPILFTVFACDLQIYDDCVLIVSTTTTTLKANFYL